MSEIAGYRVLETLGAGGEATVYLAESTDGLQKRVALKRFSAAAKKQLARELEAYRRIDEIRRKTGTTHLAEGLAAGDLADGGGYIVLGYEPRGTLADRVKRDGPVACAEAAAIAGQVLEALEHLHAAGLCHRDVKPQNVLVGADGRARLGDFGLSTDRDGSISTGGSPAFAAPEQWEAGEQGGRAGAAIDVYGAGATLYYLLAGRAPRPGAPDIFLLEARRVPRAVQKVLLAALAAEPGARFASARAFAAALRAALEERPRRARRRGGAAIAGAAVLAGLVFLGMKFSGRTRPSEKEDPAHPSFRAVRATESEGPRLQAEDGRTIALPGAAVAVVALPDGRLAVGTAEGAVLLVDPVRPHRPPAELARFGHAVLALEWKDGALRARGDDRRPAPLGAAEEAPAGSTLVEGASGRYAFPRAALVREAAIEVPPP